MVRMGARETHTVPALAIRQAHHALQRSDCSAQASPTVSVTLPVPSHSGQGLPLTRPVPLQARQIFSAVCGAAGDASSPGFWGRRLARGGGTSSCGLPIIGVLLLRLSRRCHSPVAGDSTDTFRTSLVQLDEGLGAAAGRAPPRPAHAPCLHPNRSTDLPLSASALQRRRDRGPRPRDAREDTPREPPDR
jgi:hypothetical protein